MMLSAPTASMQNRSAGAQFMPLVVIAKFRLTYSLGSSDSAGRGWYEERTGCIWSSRYSQYGSPSPRCPRTIRSRGNRSKTPPQISRRVCRPVSAWNPQMPVSRPYLLNAAAIGAAGERGCR